MICNIFSHQTDWKKIKEILAKHYPKAKIEVEEADTSGYITATIPGGFLSSNKKIKIACRQRVVPSYNLAASTNDPVVRRLTDLYNYIASIPAKNNTIKELLLRKTETINSEFCIREEKCSAKELKPFLADLANDLDAFLLVQPNTVISKADGEHFLDKALNLLLDSEGNCEVETLSVEINASTFDSQEPITEEQLQRKHKSEQILSGLNIAINKRLPCIEAEDATTIRSKEEIGRRVSILAITNLVAFGNISSEWAIEYLKEGEMWDYVTPAEKFFLANPTDEKKSNETWKCEDIWVLMWALNKVDDLGPVDQLCALTNIPAEEYPVAENRFPNEFIAGLGTLRSAKEILDAADLYYRADWACVDARIKGREMENAHPGVVYERHYALNWLINYMNQDWDDITCDT